MREILNESFRVYRSTRFCGMRHRETMLVLSGLRDCGFSRSTLTSAPPCNAPHRLSARGCEYRARFREFLIGKHAKLLFSTDARAYARSAQRQCRAAIGARIGADLTALRKSRLSHFSVPARIASERGIAKYRQKKKKSRI